MQQNRVTRGFVLAFAALVVVAASGRAQQTPAPAEPTVRITVKPAGLVSGTLQVPVMASAPVERLALFVNGVPSGAAAGRTMTQSLNVGFYLRRLRVRAVGYDGAGKVVGEDEMTVNDPRPPFRARLQGPAAWPTSGSVTLFANVLRPAEVRIGAVDFFVGEEKVASATEPPYAATVDAARFPGAVYARAVARAGDQEANDVLLFGDPAHASEEVTLQQVPVSIVGTSAAPLRADTVTLWDGDAERAIEGLVPAADQPLHVILLVDYSESMLEELPVVKAAARQFAQQLLRPQDRIAVVGFNQRPFWLTGWTNDWNAVAAAIERGKPAGQTHLYDSVIQMLFELQKTPGRHALVVLTDGVDQGSRFELDHLVHYARYAGVPLYPVIKNRLLSRWMRFGVGRLEARRIARVAEDTGATWFLIQRESELAGVYAKIAQELRQQYQLVFRSEPGTPDQWRPLKIASADGQRLRAPRGYFP
ncbi:MAG TPA: VWA domain-containing protein [Thermoanaerobaculia bacterium]|nr:VWA domain-containing protein [Thermoanaerobaculia bacterium]